MLLDLEWVCFLVCVEHCVLTEEDSRLIQKSVAGGVVQFWCHHSCTNCVLCVVGMIVHLSLCGVVMRVVMEVTVGVCSLSEHIGYQMVTIPLHQYVKKMILTFCLRFHCKFNQFFNIV